MTFTTTVVGTTSDESKRREAASMKRVLCRMAPAPSTAVRPLTAQLARNHGNVAGSPASVWLSPVADAGR